MKYLHTMIRISDIDKSLDFFCAKLGLREVERYTSESGRYTLIYLAAPADLASAETDRAPLIELTYNWDPEAYTGGRRPHRCRPRRRPDGRNCARPCKPRDPSCR